MFHRTSPRPVIRKSLAMRLFHHELRMKVSHIESHMNTALDGEDREKCDSYDHTRMIIYHEA